VRLRAWPVPKTCLESSIATSVDHLAAIFRSPVPPWPPGRW
jgi:hypothetical protein